MEKSKNKGKKLGALLVMALLGAAAGVLFAPEKGSKTRAMLLGGAKSMADDITKKVKNEAQAIKETAKELKNLAEAKGKELVNNTIG